MEQHKNSLVLCKNNCDLVVGSKTETKEMSLPISEQTPLLPDISVFIACLIVQGLCYEGNRRQREQTDFNWEGIKNYTVHRQALLCPYQRWD